MSQKVTELSVLDKIQTAWVCESVLLPKSRNKVPWKGIGRVW